MHSGSGLARFTTVRELVRVFADAERRIRIAFAEFGAIEDSLNAVFTLGGMGPMRIDTGREGCDRCIERLRRDAWRHIVDRLELRRLMSIQRWNNLERQIEKEPPPELSEENVMAFVDQHAATFETMIREAVVEVFDWLRPHRNEYKTNSMLEVGQRVVLRYMVEQRYCGEGFHVHYHRRQELIALENVFRSLDGGGVCTRTHYSEIQNQIEQSKSDRGETTYFEWRACKNRNLHLRFKRLDLLERFNAIAGGKNLKPVQGAA